jgi:hypothetical protein
MLTIAKPLACGCLGVLTMLHSSSVVGCLLLGVGLTFLCYWARDCLHNSESLRSSVISGYARFRRTHNNNMHSSSTVQLVHTTSAYLCTNTQHPLIEHSAATHASALLENTVNSVVLSTQHILSTVQSVQCCTDNNIRSSSTPADVAGGGDGRHGSGATPALAAHSSLGCKTSQMHGSVLITHYYTTLHYTTTRHYTSLQYTTIHDLTRHYYATIRQWSSGARGRGLRLLRGAACLYAVGCCVRYPGCLFSLSIACSSR